MKQSYQELQRALGTNKERSLAKEESVNSAIRCVQRDVRPFGCVTLDQLQDGFSKLTISSDSPTLENYGQSRLSVMNAEQTQATSSASLDKLHGYLGRLEERIAALERLGQTLQNESSQNRIAASSREAINSQVTTCVTEMQGIDAALTNLKTLLEASQAEIVAVEKDKLPKRARGIDADPRNNQQTARRMHKRDSTLGSCIQQYRCNTRASR